MGLANKIPVPAPVVAGDAPKLSFGVYVHVPFCAHACDFCAFYQVEPRRADIDLYLDAIEKEFALVEPRRSDTAFWGGGTPGLLPARDLERLGRAQIARFGQPRHEWTVELAPGSVKADKLRALRDLGVTRVSMGAQSFSPRLLEALGRQHAPEQIYRAWDLVRAAGFASANLDLMFALPGQSIDDWRADLDEAVRLAPDHISTYCLTFEEDTALFVKLSAGRVSIDVERERAFYEETWERLASAGFRQYEISNHARPGHECRHNLDTWRMQTWSGFGFSAASQENGWRGANPSDLAAWSADVARGWRGMNDRVALDAAQLAEDALIFGLRMNEGVDFGALEKRFGAAALERFRPVVGEFVRGALAEWRDDNRLVLTREGRLLVDAIGSELIGTASVPAPR
jgi:oxygen-independent coproporphyrinogen-3 oxidase